MNQNARATLNDVQSAILGHICEKLNGEEWIIKHGELCNTIECHDEKLIKNALELLIKEHKITLYKYIGIKPVYYKLGQDLNKFLSIGQFRIRLEAEGQKAYEERNKNQFRNLGSPAANQVVRDTITHLSPILTLDVSRPEFARMCIRILEELVRVGVRNYQDHSYLRDPAQKYIKEHLGNERKRGETDFYQPFLRTELQRDEFFAGKIVAGAALSGGITDILTIYQIPIETKVIYSDDKGEESTLVAKGVGQDAQYASLSRVAFLSVLDLKPRNTMADLSNIQNDVKVIPVLQKEGYHDVKVVRVQHICGYGVPSEVR
jgi:hypothetical protein